MKFIANQNGFTYILALTLVVIMGIMLGMVGQSWKTITQRELEEELVFRGDQVAELIYQELLCKNATPLPGNLWSIDSPNGTVLDDLVIGKEERCTNGTTRKFRLRASAALDPLTNTPWQMISPIEDPTRFSGVASNSSIEPFRKSFKGIYDSYLLDNQFKYSDWSFTWELKQPQGQRQPQNQNINLKRSDD